ncbi:UNVERIFIED_CONTAM: hypothetical protein RMT77_004811 [Armadillidium vulgare]
MKYINLLVVGDSEVRIFWEGRNLLKDEYGVFVQTEYRSGATLEDCLGQIQRQMKPSTHIIIIWALTPFAWRRTTIKNPEQQETTIFRPSLHLSIDQIPAMMNQIMRHVLQVNPNCRVYLSIPAVKDLYRFNQTRLIQAWGEDYRDFLEDHMDYNPERMRRYSLQAYYLFCGLKKGQYRWEGKNLLYGNGALNCYNYKRPNARSQRKIRVAHTEYLNGMSLHLNSELIPDGLHGNQTYLKYYLINNKGIFKQFRDFPPHRPLQKKVKKQGLLGDCPQDSDTVWKVNRANKMPKPSEKTPLPMDRVTECLYQFADMEQPSTSSQGRVYITPTPYTGMAAELQSSATPIHFTQAPFYQHQAPLATPTNNIPFYTVMGYDCGTVSDHIQNDFNSDAHIAVRDFLETRRQKGHGDKKRQLQDLDDVIKVAEQEKEIIKKRKK